MDSLITVAICTRNRSAKLSMALDSLVEMKPPRRSDWEVLIVDNGSSDGTTDVVTNFEGRLPVRYLFHAVVGLSNARNAAVKEASGDYIVWTDDDNIVESDWLRAYEGAFARYPGTAIFGGPVGAHFHDTQPRWLRDGWERVTGAYGLRSLGAREAPLKADRRYLPFGGNYAIKRAVQREHLYDPDLGRQGNRMIGGEELDVMLRVLEKGAVGYWIPSAVVHHVITSERLTTAYLRRYYRGLGATSVIREEKEACQATDHRSIVMLGARAIRLEAKYWLSRLFRHPEQWLSDLAAASRLEGRLLARLNRTLRPTTRDLPPVATGSGQKA